jgi:hypothetical protein
LASASTATMRPNQTKSVFVCCFTRVYRQRAA